MVETNRERMLSRLGAICQRLHKIGNRFPVRLDDTEHLMPRLNRHQSFETLLLRLEQECGRIGARFMASRSRERIREHVRTVAEGLSAQSIFVTSHPLCNDLQLVSYLAEHGLSVESPLDLPRSDPGYHRHLAGVELVISGVDAVVAETATIMLTNSPAAGLASTLLPLHHVAIFRRDQLLPDFDDLLHRIADSSDTNYGFAPFFTWITGASRTADIEKTLVQPAHGPKTLHLVLWEE